MRWKALDEIYTIYMLLQRSDLNILANFRKNCDFRAVQRSALCRSRRELSDAFFLAKFGFDTAENVFEDDPVNQPTTSRNRPNLCQKKNDEAHRFRAIMRDGGLRSRYLQKRLQASGPAHAAFRRLTQHPQVAAVFDKYKVRQLFKLLNQN